MTKICKSTVVAADFRQSLFVSWGVLLVDIMPPSFLFLFNEQIRCVTMEWRALKVAGVRPAALGDLLLPLATNYTEQSYRLPISSLQDNFIIS